MKLLAEKIIKIFLIQVFQNNFFHADIHPGNVFVDYRNPKDPSYIFIDCGLIGSLEKEDKYYIAENFIAFFNKDYKKIVNLHIQSGWVSKNVNSEDFEFTIRATFDPIFKKSLKKISLDKILIYTFFILRKFNIKVQPQLILLQKTIFYTESLSKKIYPKIDIWKIAKPFLQNWIKEQLSIKNAIKSLFKEGPFFFHRFIKISEKIAKILEERNIEKKIINSFIQNKEQNKKYIYITFLFFIGLIFFLLGIILYFLKCKEEKYFINKNI